MALRHRYEDLGGFQANVFTTDDGQEFMFGPDDPEVSQLMSQVTPEQAGGQATLAGQRLLEDNPAPSLFDPSRGAIAAGSGSRAAEKKQQYQEQAVRDKEREERESSLAAQARSQARERIVADNADSLALGKTAEDFPGGNGSPPGGQPVSDDGQIAAQDDVVTPLDAYIGAGGNLIERVGRSPARWSPDKRSYQHDPGTADAFGDAYDRLAIAERNLAAQRFEEQTLQNESNVLELQRKRQVLAEQVKEKESLLRERQEFQKTELDRLDAQQQDLLSRKIDPKRVFKDAEPAQTLLMILSVGLGAAGQSLAGGENQAMRMFERWIDTDIQQQQSDLAADMEKAENERSIFARKLSEGGDPEIIKAEIKDLQLSYAQREIEQMQAETEGSAMKTELGQMLLSIEERRLQNRQSIVEKFGVKFDDRYRQASGGGLRVSPIAKDLAALGQSIASTDKTYAQAGKLRQDAAEAKAGAPLAERVQSFGKAMQQNKIVESQAALGNLRSAIARYSKNGDIPGVGGVANLFEPGSSAEVLMGEGSKEIRRLASNVRDLILLRRRSGGASTPNEERLYQYIGGNTSVFDSDKDFLKALDSYEGEISAQERGLSATFGSDARNAWRSGFNSAQATPLGASGELVGP